MTASHGRLRAVTGHRAGVAQREVDVLVAVDVGDPVAVRAVEVEREAAAPLGHPRHRHAAEQVPGGVEQRPATGVGGGVGGALALDQGVQQGPVDRGHARDHGRRSATCQGLGAFDSKVSAHPAATNLPRVTSTGEAAGVSRWRRAPAARVLHATTATLVTAALVLQVVVVVRDGVRPVGARLLDLAGSFAIQSNLLVAFTAVTLALRADRDGPVWRVARLDALLGITVTGLVSVSGAGPGARPRRRPGGRRRGAALPEPCARLLRLVRLRPAPSRRAVDLALGAGVGRPPTSPTRSCTARSAGGTRTPSSTSGCTATRTSWAARPWSRCCCSASGPCTGGATGACPAPPPQAIPASGIPAGLSRTRGPPGAGRARRAARSARRPSGR